jgi:hypothetical protein
VADFPRVTRLDAPLVLDQLARAQGTGLAEDGKCQGGAVGACYVRWPDGHRSVLTSQPPGGGPAARRQGALAEAARAAGIPAPRYELIAELPCAVAIVQELLPGTPPATINQCTLDSMVELNRRCRGLLAGHDEIPVPSLYLLTDGPGYCLHGPMARYDRRTARLLGAIEEIGASVPDQLDGVDLVHFDFHPGNVLVDAAGMVTGVVDWDGACRGHGDLDLFTLRFDLGRRAPWLGRQLGPLLAETITEDVAQACWAHMSLRLVDWCIREHPGVDVAAWLEVAESLQP